MYLRGLNMNWSIIEEWSKKTSKNFGCSTIVILILMLFIISTLPIKIGMVHNVEGGKYGNIVPTTFELQLLEKINENRSANNAPPLKLNTTLWWVARAHSQDMIDYDFFDHKSSEEGQFNGATFQERVNNYAEYKNTYIGETIALRSSGIDVEWCMSAWKDSPPHWDIIINPNLKEVGIGLIEGEWSGCSNAGLHTADFGGRSISEDLAIDEGDIMFDIPSPYEGEELNISANIHNQGQTDSFPVNVKFFDGDPESGGVLIGEEQQIPHILNHGESAVISVKWDTTGKAGNHEIYVVLDDENIISEMDEGNNKALKSLVVNPTNSSTNSPIHLDAGWNLVSFPYVVYNTDIEIVLSSIDGDYNAVQWYNAFDSMDCWKHYHTSKPSFMNDLNEIDNKKGFWIHITNNNGADLIINGNAPSSTQNVLLRKGWNLVGYPSTTAKKRDIALDNLTFGNEIDAVEYYESSTQKIKSLGEKGFMKPGRGYWFHATQDCVWTVDI
jgi:hypothetical protein